MDRSGALALPSILNEVVCGPLHGLPMKFPCTPGIVAVCLWREIRWRRFAGKAEYERRRRGSGPCYRHRLGRSCGLRHRCRQIRVNQEPDELLQANRSAFRGDNLCDRFLVGRMGPAPLVLVAAEYQSRVRHCCGIRLALPGPAAYISTHRRSALAGLRRKMKTPELAWRQPRRLLIVRWLTARPRS